MAFSLLIISQIGYNIEISLKEGILLGTLLVIFLFMPLLVG